MKKVVVYGLLILLLFTILTPVSAQETNRIAVLDFEVQSGNADYQYLGKGFAEFIAVELAAVRGITIIDREKRNAVIEEQKFSLSGLADDAGGVELGNMLAANYLVTGTVFDMFGQLEVTLKLIDIEKGAAAAVVQSGGEPKEYKRIVSELSEAVSASLDTGSAVPPKPAQEPEVVLDNEQADVVLASFSEAIEAVDNKDTARAKEKLQTVQAVDKTNKAARYYLNKLQALSPKFRVETQPYAPIYSPASLGFIEEGKIYLWTSVFMRPPWLPFEGDSYEFTNGRMDMGDYIGTDTQSALAAGIAFPLGEIFGVEAGIHFSGDEVNLAVKDGTDLFTDVYNNNVQTDIIRNGISNWGGYAEFGVKALDWFSLGISSYVWYVRYNSEEYRDRSYVAFSVSPDFMLRSGDGNLIFDLSYTYTNKELTFVDPDTYIADSAALPMLVDASLTYGIPDIKLFLGLRGMVDIYYSALSGHALRIIPMAEYWITDFLSIRGGYEYSHLALAGEFSIGHGAVAGLTVKAGDFDINANIAYRHKPMRLLPGYTNENMKILFGIEYNAPFLKR